jgi:hypothetical protein
MIHYLCRRLAERSTRLAILGTLITGAGSIAGALPSPWCFILLGISAAHALMPDKSAKE